ncbi:hypothetical protein RJT34_25444 [Clitoria ternatea]|uniref:Uncharacterized protein n=1 Tax=Clitoria ternatea TaxID=43366 RepID=A0AAN9FW38_CLITE
MKCGVLAVIVVCTFAATTCAVNSDDNLVPTRREVYDNGQIFDISHSLQCREAKKGCVYNMATMCMV